MKTNISAVENFYAAFQNKDFKVMQDTYADASTFSDAVFKGLNGAEVRAMWEMLCKRSGDLKIEFSNVHATETTATAEWVATYTFTRTGKRVVNRVRAEFIFTNGKIVQHTDTFSFYKWARQAFGFTGWLLGWTGAFRKKVQTIARAGLNEFMAAK